jgi:hypothetical protein
MKRALAATATFASLAAAQVQPPSPPDFPAWPADWAVSRFAPVADAIGLPVPRPVLAAGDVDFDRDGNRDLWFMTATGGQAQVHALLANTADLGRFWSWGDYAPGSLRDAATYRSAAAFDMVVAVDPTVDRLDHHFFVPNPNAPDPRLAGTWGHNPGWLVGLGCREIETANHDGDAHDDLLLLRDAGGGSTEVKLVRMGAPFGGLPSPQHEVSLVLPWPLSMLRALDADGDGATDAAVHAPGLGVLVLRSLEKSFAVVDALPLAAGLRDLCVGDSDGDGRDELGVVLDAGVVLLHPGGARTALANPGGSPAATAARIVDFDRDGRPDIVVALASGDGVLVHQHGNAGFDPPRQHRPAVAPPAGTGPLGQALLTFDVDGDGDVDVLTQLRDGSFVTLRSLHRSVAPLVAEVVHEGRFSESYISERIDLTLPPGWRSAGIDAVEVGIYMRHPTQPNRPWVLWAHTVIPVPPNPPVTASVRLLYLVDLTRLHLLTSAYLYPQGFAVSGDTLLSIHGKVGQRRCESMLVFHEGRGDENRSTLGVQWRVIAAPPLPRADAQLLPF